MCVGEMYFSISTSITNPIPDPQKLELLLHERESIVVVPDKTKQNTTYIHDKRDKFKQTFDPSRSIDNEGHCSIFRKTTQIRHVELFLIVVI